jgi:hypothetical protein
MVKITTIPKILNTIWAAKNVFRPQVGRPSSKENLEVELVTKRCLTFSFLFKFRISDENLKSEAEFQKFKIISRISKLANINKVIQVIKDLEYPTTCRNGITRKKLSLDNFDIELSGESFYEIFWRSFAEK